MARLRYNGLSTTLGASLTNSATSITFAAALTYNGGTAVPTITGSDYIPLSILDSTGKLSEIVWMTAYTTAGTTGTITRGQEGTTGVSHASGDKVANTSTAGGGELKSYAEATRTSGDITLNSTSITTVDTGLDLTISAAAGDLVEYGISGLLSAVAQAVALDVYTVPSGSTVNPFGAGLSASNATLQGVAGWEVTSGNSATTQVSGSVTRILTSGDVASGATTLRLMYVKANTTARSLFAQTNIPLKVWAKNYGQV